MTIVNGFFIDVMALTCVFLAKKRNLASPLPINE
jgi:hypothetical protein